MAFGVIASSPEDAFRAAFRDYVAREEALTGDAADAFLKANMGFRFDDTALVDKRLDLPEDAEDRVIAIYKEETSPVIVWS